VSAVKIALSAAASSMTVMAYSGWIGVTVATSV
jgi:hypothetical protein